MACVSASKWILGRNCLFSSLRSRQTLGDPKAYQAYLRSLWLAPPRYWKGWEIADDVILMTQLEKLVPDHIYKHLQRYWESRLMPDLPTNQFYHLQSKEAHLYAPVSSQTN